MKKIILVATISTCFFASCGNSTSDEHDHEDGTHEHGEDSHEHNADGSHDDTHHQEEFDVVNDTTAQPQEHSHGSEDHNHTH